MAYWNQAVFQLLQQFSQSYQDEVDFKYLAQYCDYRDKGLRKQAFFALKQFIQYCEQQPLEKQRAICLFLLDVIENSRINHVLLSHPLQQYLLTILEQWQVAEPHQSFIYQWMGYLTHDVRLYHQAYQLDPQNQRAIYAIANAYLSQVDWQMHHLGESYFIGEEHNAVDALAQAKRFLQQLKDHPKQTMLWQEYEQYVNLLQAWQRYCASNQSINFVEWCAQQQIDFSANVVVYYSK